MKRDSAIPIYIQLEEYIKNNIENKVYPPGSMLPTEREFTELFGVSRMTVRQAIGNLVNQGMLYKIRGKGTFVAREMIEKQMEIQSFTEDMLSRGLKPGSELIQFIKMVPEEEIRSSLELTSNEEVYLLNRLRLADGEPMAMEYCYLPVKYFPDLIKYNFIDCSLYDILINEFNLKIGYIKETIMAVKMDKGEAELLTKKDKGFGLMSKRIMYNSQNIPMEFTRTIYHPDRYTFNMVLRNNII